jgi:hypothetical protein
MGRPERTKITTITIITHNYEQQHGSSTSLLVRPSLSPCSIPNGILTVPFTQTRRSRLTRGVQAPVQEVRKRPRECDHALRHLRLGRVHHYWWVGRHLSHDDDIYRAKMLDAYMRLSYIYATLISYL